MKAKLATIISIAALACGVGRAQNTPAGAQPGVTPSPAPAAPAPAETTAAAPAAAAEPAHTTTEAAVSPAAVIPLIQLQEVELTKAIENLARQAGLNYILDPKVPFGQPDPQTGKVLPQPMITLRWENLTAEQALMGLLTTYSLQIVEDPKTRISRITVKDPAAPDPLVTKIVQLKYAAASNMVAAVQTTFTDKRSKVVPDVRTSQLVIVATEKEQIEVATMIEQLDTPTKQVLIEARLMEISRSPKTVKGIDWSDTLSAQRFTYGNGFSKADTTTTIPGGTTTTTLPGGRTTTSSSRSTESTIINTLSGNGGFSVNTFSGVTPNIGFLNADGVSAVLSFLNSDADAQVISTPRAVTLDNETADLSVVRAVPIFKNTAGTQGSPGGSEVTYTNLGTILKVTPRISANDMVWMKVVPEVSSIFKTDRKIVAGTVNEADEYDIRRIEAQVIIPSANTLVMGGLLSDSTKNLYTKVPILGDLPLLGLAFRHEDKSREKKNLLIFITPTIVKDTDYQPTKTDFLQSKPIQMEGGINPNDPWESGKPKDWSNPEATPYEEAVFNDKGAEPKTPPQPQANTPAKP